MNAAEALKAAKAAGVHLGIDGDDLLLTARVAPPVAVLETLSRHKAEIVSLLRPGRDGWSAEDWRTYFDERAAIAEFDGKLLRAEAEAQAFEACVVEWLNRNPAPSPAGCCAWCGRSESIACSIVPFGTEPGTHTWLHSQCSGQWHNARRMKAVNALTSMNFASVSQGGN